MIKRLEKLVNYNLVLRMLGSHATEYGCDENEYAYNVLVEIFNKDYPFITIEEYKKEIVLAIYIAFFENKVKKNTMKDVLGESNEDYRRLFKNIEKHVNSILQNEILKDIPNEFLENKWLDQSINIIENSYEKLIVNISNNEKNLTKGIDFDELFDANRNLKRLFREMMDNDRQEELEGLEFDDFVERKVIPINKLIVKANKLSKNYNLEKINIVENNYSVRKDTVKASNIRNKTSETIFEKIDLYKLNNVTSKQLKEKYFEDMICCYEELKSEIDKNNDLSSIINFVIFEKRYNIFFSLKESYLISDFIGEEKKGIIEFLKKYINTDFFIYREKIIERTIDSKRKLNLLEDIKKIEKLNSILNEIVLYFLESKLLTNINDIVITEVVSAVNMKIQDIDLNKYVDCDKDFFLRFKKILGLKE